MAGKGGEYTSEKGTPGRYLDKSSRDLTPSEHARVVRITAHRTSEVEDDTTAKTASILTNKYSEEVDFGEEV